MPTLARELDKLEMLVRQRTGQGNPALDRLRADPTRLMADAGLPPDPWQAELLSSTSKRMLLNCSRQSGKSQVAAALALKAALLDAPALVLLLSPTQRQSAELFRDKVMKLYNALGRPVAATQESALTMQLANGSRIVSLPGDEETIRGYSGVVLLVVDEASRVSDALYRAVRPMLAVSGGRLICMSTPYGKRGFFFEEWTGSGPWKRISIKATQCPRIDAAFLEEEREAIGERWYRQEYLCSFEDTMDSLFTWDQVQAAKADDLQPLFVEAL